MSDFRPSELIERFLDASDRKAHLEGLYGHMKDMQDDLYNEAYSRAYLSASGSHNDKLNNAKLIAIQKIKPYRDELRKIHEQLHQSRAAVEAIKMEDKWRLEESWKERTYDKMEVRHG